MDVTQSSIQSGIKQLGLSNSIVCVHSSLKSFGHVEGGPQTIIDGFMAEGCTLLVPTFSDDFSIPPPEYNHPLQNGWNYKNNFGSNKGIGRVYSPETNEITIEEMGAFPALVLTQTNRIRGNHPLCSFTAIGPKASALISTQTAQDVFAPLKTLCDLDGWVLLMGVRLDTMTLIHAAEEEAGRNLFVRWANGPDGNPSGVTMGGCANGFSAFTSALLPLKINGRVGNSTWTAYPSSEAMRKCVRAIKENPEITHCGLESCERCHDAAKGGPIPM